MIDLTGVTGTASAAPSYLEQRVERMPQQVVVVAVTASRATNAPVIVTTINADFHAWEALSDEVFDSWERKHKQGDEL